MAFQMPEYHQPDFSKEQFIKAPDAKLEIVEIDGVAPEYFHSTSMFPEYFKIQGKWVLAEESLHGFQRCDLPGWTFGGSRKQESQKR